MPSKINEVAQINNVSFTRSSSNSLLEEGGGRRLQCCTNK